METLLETYSTAITCSVLIAILALLQSFIGAAFKFGPGKGVAGIPVDGGHTSLPFRMERAHLNMVENLGPFSLTLGLAMLAGVSASWVNWVALIFLLARTAHWLFYALGIGAFRTLCFAVGFFATLGLAIKTLLTVL